MNASSIITVRDRVMNALRTIEGVKSVRPFAGELTLEAASQKIMGVHEVFVSVVSGDNAPDSAPMDMDMQAVFGVFIVTRNQKNREERERLTLALAERVALLVHGNTFELAGVGPARVLGMSPLGGETGEALEKKGVNVWSVVWEQRLVLGGVA